MIRVHMIRRNTTRQTMVGWLRLARAFRAEMAREQRLMWISAGTVLGGVLFRILEPWPLKFIYNAVFLKHQYGLWLTLLRGLGTEAQVAIFAVSMIVITGLAATFEYLSTVAMGVAASRILADIRGKLFRHLANLSISFHGRNRTGDLVTHVTYDVDRMREVIVSSLLPFLTNVLTLIAMVGVMFWMNWTLGCIVAVAFPVFFFVVNRKLRGPSHPETVSSNFSLPLSRSKMGWIRYLRFRLLDTSVLRTCLLNTNHGEWHSGMSVSR